MCLPQPCTKTQGSNFESGSFKSRARQRVPFKQYAGKFIIDSREKEMNHGDLQIHVKSWKIEQF